MCKTSIGCWMVMIMLAVQPCLLADDAQAPAAGIIPRPRKMDLKSGAFVLNERSVISVKPSSGEMKALGNHLAGLLAPATGWKLAVKSPWLSRPAGIALMIDTARRDLGDEGYALACAPGGITITAPRPAGIFYGLQTLRQLLPAQVERREQAAGVEWRVPCVLIEDSPRFAWRGYLLDPARHFRTKDELKRYIDLLALQKLNVLQLHLTDDQGWRIEITKYPKLTGTGSRLPDCSGTRGEGRFYSRADIRELVAYAASRHVTILPEIEMPGHSGAATTSYPELGCGGKPSSQLCVSREGTYEYACSVLDEVMALFPSPCIHVGADEVAPDRWLDCPACGPAIEALRKTELPPDVMRSHVHVSTGAGRPFNADVARLQGEFVRRIDAYLASKGRRMIGWDEILDGGLRTGSRAAVMAWRSAGAIEGAVSQERDVILSLYPEHYLDNGTALQRTYDYEPLPASLPAGSEKHLIGVQGNMWGEATPTIQRIDEQSFPRLCAIAEVGWTSRENRDFQDFSRRLPSFCERLVLLGVNCRKPVAQPPR